jgi:two-component system alkaline phosphatase synthesis response regulator PhoP
VLVTVVRAKLAAICPSRTENEMTRRILVVDDEMLIRRLLQQTLESEGYWVTTVGSMYEALAEVGRNAFDLIVLDRVLPDGDGMEACRRIRDRYQTPIIMLTAKREITDRVQGLETGADDYMVKPFDVEELVARVKAQLRRSQDLAGPDRSDKIGLGRIVIDPDSRDALIDGKEVGLTPKEFKMLEFLAKRRGRAVSRDEILENLWEDETPESDKIVAVYIRRLRKKLEADPDQPVQILTVRGFGYKVAG